MSSVQVAIAAFIFVHYMLSRKRSLDSGTSLLADLQCQEFSGQYKILLEWHQRILNY